MAQQNARNRSLDLFMTEIYGPVPPPPHGVTVTVLDDHVHGAIRRQQWALDLTLERGTHRSIVMVDRPIEQRPKAVFLGLNFRGNHACDDDPAIIDPAERDDAGSIHYEGLREPIELPVQRGSLAHRWPISRVVERGYAVATACYLQIGPDSPQFARTGLVPLLPDPANEADSPQSIGALSVWAWYLSQVLDVLKDGRIHGAQESPIIAVGHSRLGKAALWAAALDTRFAAVVSNNSGCMGAAMSRPVGETPELLADVRPQWFTPRFGERLLGGGALSVDQPDLLSMIAPRPLYVASASEDDPADPEGEFLSLVWAAEAWDGAEKPWRPSFPGPGGKRWHPERPLGYHLRSGEHEMREWDWKRWLEFADRWIDGAPDPVVPSSTPGHARDSGRSHRRTSPRTH